MAKKIKDAEEMAPETTPVEEVTEEVTEATEGAKDAPENESSDNIADEGKKELEETKDRYLRLAAEYDNFRKRTMKEKERMYADATVKAVKELLPSLDNLERALESATEKESALYQGLDMTLKQMKEQFAKLGVTEVDTAEGTKFDPNFHEAIMHEDDGSGESVIAQTFLKGYVRDGQVVRPALVKTRG